MVRRRPAGPSSRLINCEYCRTKKVRCDRVQPCSFCETHGVTCIFSGARPPAQRLLAAGPSTLPAAPSQEAELLRRVDALTADVASLRRSTQQQQPAPPQDSPDLHRALLPDDEVMRHALAFYLDHINVGFYALEPVESRQKLATHAARGRPGTCYGSTGAQGIALGTLLCVYAMALCEGFRPHSPQRDFSTPAPGIEALRSAGVALYRGAAMHSRTDLPALRFALLLCVLLRATGGAHEALSMCLVDVVQLTYRLGLQREPSARLYGAAQARDRLNLFITVCCLDWGTVGTTKAFTALRDAPVLQPLLNGRASPLEGSSSGGGGEVLDTYMALKFRMARFILHAQRHRTHAAEEGDPAADSISEAALAQQLEAIHKLADGVLEGRAASGGDAVEAALRHASLSVLLAMLAIVHGQTTSRLADDTSAALDGCAQVIRVFVQLLARLLTHYGVHTSAALPPSSMGVEYLIAQQPGLWRCLWFLLQNVATAVRLFRSLQLHVLLHGAPHAGAAAPPSADIELVEHCLRALQAAGMLPAAEPAPDDEEHSSYDELVGALTFF